MSALVRHQGVEQQGSHGRVRETACDHLQHDRRTVPLAQVSLFADPDVERTQVRRDVAPVVRLFHRRVGDLESSDGPPCCLGNQELSPGDIARKLGLPVEEAVWPCRGLDVAFLIPGFQEVEVGGRCGAQTHVVLKEARMNARAR